MQKRRGMQIFVSMIAIAAIAFSTMTTTACNTADFVKEFDQYTSQIVPAVNSILAILSLFGVASQSQLPPKIDADVTAVQKLVADFAEAPASSQPGIRNQIASEETVLNADLQQVFQVAAVSDPNTQTKVSALITLVESAVSEGFALIPQSSSVVNTAHAIPAGTKFQAKDFVDSFNAIITSKTGNKAVDAATPKLKLKKHAHKAHQGFWASLGNAIGEAKFGN